MLCAPPLSSLPFVPHAAMGGGISPAVRSVPSPGPASRVAIRCEVSAGGRLPAPAAPEQISRVRRGPLRPAEANLRLERMAGASAGVLLGLAVGTAVAFVPPTAWATDLQPAAVTVPALCDTPQASKGALSELSTLQHGQEVTCSTVEPVALTTWLVVGAVGVAAALVGAAVFLVVTLAVITGTMRVAIYLTGGNLRDS